MNKLFSRAGLLVLALLAIFITALTNYLFKGTRLDLTEDHVYTLSEGTHNLLKGLPGPVTLKLFYSDKQTANMPQFRNYSNRVQELLQEYVQASAGKLTLETIDPEPFSEEEDSAAGYGLQAVPLSQGGGNEIYFGLVIIGNDNPDKKEVISFLHPDKERFLEYDLSKLVFAVSQKEKPKVGLVSGLQVNGGFDMASRQQTPPWMSVSQMEQVYDVQDLGTDFEDIDDDIRLLLVIFPQKLSGKARYAVDQFVLRGGHVLAFVDPYAEQAGQGGGGFMMGMGGMGGDKFASLPDLFKVWGIEMDTTKVVGDSKYALMVSSRTGRPMRHLGLLGYGVDNLASDDVIMAGLESLNFGTAGHITQIKDATTEFHPLVQSSDQSMLIDAGKFTFLSDPKTLFDGFQPTGERYVLAARITGPVKTAFPDGVPPEDEKPEVAADDEDDLDLMDNEVDVDVEDEEEEEASKPIVALTEEDDIEDQAEDSSEAEVQVKPKRPHLSESQLPANIIVVADTDVLTDRLWVQVNSFFGQQIVTPFANNGDMLVNMVDNLLGNADLISIRSRGKFSRPFTRVNDLEQEAEARFREKADALNERLKETENKLRELQASKEGEEKLALSDEQQQTVEQFQQEKLKIRKELREVQHQLGKDIEQLGTVLKLINIFAIPLLLTVIVLIVRCRRQRIIRR